MASFVVAEYGSALIKSTNLNLNASAVAAAIGAMKVSCLSKVKLDPELFVALPELVAVL